MTLTVHVKTPERKSTIRDKDRERARKRERVEKAKIVLSMAVI